MSLVALSEQKDFMRETGSSEDDEIQTVLDEVERLLQRQCNRVEVPFAPMAEDDRVENHDGTGGTRLWLDYPISDITSITLGTDPADPAATLDPADKAVVRWSAGRRRIVRLNGVWGDRNTPLYITVTYDAQADSAIDLEMAKLAIKRRVAAIWRQRGVEGMTSVGESDVRMQADRNLDQLSEWKAAVFGLRRLSVL